MTEPLLHNYFNDIDRAITTNQLESMQGSRILITGARGLIGSALVDMCLRNSMEVYAAGRSTELLRSRFHYWDRIPTLNLVEYDAVHDISFNLHADFVIHAAANAHPIMYAKKPLDTMLGILTGTSNILQLTREIGARLLLVSSSEVYGLKTTYGPYSESDYGFLDTLNHRACYPSAKRTAETMCAAHAEEFGTKFIIARPGHVFGPMSTRQDSRAAAQFARSAAERTPITLKSAGLQMRSYCYALDCASAMLSLLDRGTLGQPYNIAHEGMTISIRDLAALFAKQADVPLHFEEPSPSEVKSYNLMDNSTLDGSKLINLGWKMAFPPSKAVDCTLRQLPLFSQ